MSTVRNTLTFGEWLPDQPDLGTPGIITAQNVIPAAVGYRPFARLAEDSTSALTDIPLGLFGAQAEDGSAYMFAGDTNDLYRYVSSAWSSVGGSAYGTGSEERWEFALWGDTVIATNYTAPPQKYRVGTDPTFSDLAGSPPRFRHIAVVRDFVVGAYVNDSVDGVVPYRVKWSALGDHEDWANSAATQSDFQDIYGGGPIRGMVGGEYGVILTERSVWRMTYVGSPLIFQFDEVEKERGCLSRGSVASIGQAVFYLSDNGWYVFDGNGSRAIGEEKVDRWFFETFDTNYLENIWSSVDSDNNIVMWAFPGPGNVGGLPNYILIYNYALDRWSYALQDTYCLGRVLTTATTVDSLSDTIDSVDIPVDARKWSGGQPLSAGISSNKRLGYFNGAPLNAQFVTTEFQIQPGFRSMLTEVWPLVDGTATPTARISTRNRQADTIATGSPATMNSVGFCPVRAEGRFHRIQIDLSGTFSHAQGVELILGGTGGR